MFFLILVYFFLPKDNLVDGDKYVSDIKTVQSKIENNFSLNSFNETKILNKKEKEIKEKELFEYLEVIDSCNQYFVGGCINVRNGPGVNYGVITRLRNGVVLKAKEKVKFNEEEWYQISFEDEWLRYPERVEGDLYISAKYVKSFLNEGKQELKDETQEYNYLISTTSKMIIVDRSDQKLYAYEKGELFMKESVSTGLDVTPTPRGIFHVYKKTPSRYMQGPIEGISEKEYDLPGVPWNLYFTREGAVIHGAYWHDNFGKQWSNGCVNLPIDKAKELYMWADIGTEIIIRD